jgi:nucleotide-binding universal stress UspA family protein
LYTNIVVGTDFSETAEQAVEQAVEIAKAFGSTLHIVTAFKPAMTASIAGSSLEAMAYGGADMLRDAESAIADEVAARLGALQMKYAQQGLKVITHGLALEPADALIDVCEGCGADLVIVGNRGMGGVKRFVLGSVPNKISHHSPCSVLIVHTS